MLSFLETIARPLLFLHLIGAFVLIGAQTHLLVVMYNFYRKNKPNFRLMELYPRIYLWTFWIMVGLGSIIYPVFRVYVRAAYFDSVLPWATGLFEIKEHVAALGFVLVYFLRYFALLLKPTVNRIYFHLFTAGNLILYIFIWYMIIVGFLLTTLKSI